MLETALSALSIIPIKTILQSRYYFKPHFTDDLVRLSYIEKRNLPKVTNWALATLGLEYEIF